MATERAMRLADYLVWNLGFNVFKQGDRCWKCGRVEFDDSRYCRDCGTRFLDRAELDAKVFDKLEGAIGWALGEYDD